MSIMYPYRNKTYVHYVTIKYTMSIMYPYRNKTCPLCIHIEIKHVHYVTIKIKHVHYVSMYRNKTCPLCIHI